MQHHREQPYNARRAGRGRTEVANRLASVLGTAEEEGSGSSGLAEGKLVKSEALSTGSLNAGARRLGEAKGGDRELGDLEETDVVGDGGDGDNDVGGGELLVGLGDLAGDTGEGEGRAVDARHIQTAEDDLVELGVGSAGEEAVKLSGVAAKSVLPCQELYHARRTLTKSAR